MAMIDLGGTLEEGTMEFMCELQLEVWGDATTKLILVVGASANGH